jgi:Acetyltransferase (GNAT) family.
MSKIKIVKDNEDFEKELGLNLHNFNRQKCEYISKNSSDEHCSKEVINLAVYNENTLIGGASGYIKYCWYYLDLLWINENYRKQKMGTQLINEIEIISRKRNCIGIRTETWDFQAKGFYEKKRICCLF